MATKGRKERSESEVFRQAVAIDELGLDSDDEQHEIRKERALSNIDNIIKGTNSRVGTVLNEVPLLATLSEGERARLGGSMTELLISSGKDVFREGDQGTKFYIISEGQAVVSKQEGASKIQLATLNPGDFFGETALLNSAPRGATVTAKGDLYVLWLDKEDFEKLFDEDRLNVQFAKRGGVTAEAMRGAGSDPGAGTYADSISPPPNAIRDKDAKLHKLIKKAVHKTLLFADLDEPHVDEVISAMYRVEIAKGTQVITQGELGSNLYVVEKGKFDIYVEKEDSKKGPKKVASRGAGKCFGELALMYNAPRAATVTARNDSVLWVVDRYTFRRIAKDVSKAKLVMYADFLKRVPLLQPLADYERRKIAEALEEEWFPANTVVFKQHDLGDSVFIVKSGEVLISKHSNNNDTRASVLVNRVGPGEYFGERALLTNEPRAASVRVGDKPVALLKLDREGFNLLLGPLTEIMQRKIDGYQDYESAAKEAGVKPVPPAELARQKRKSNIVREKIEFKNLRVLGTLGKGSFGFVQLVKDITTNKKFALKAVSKQQIVETQQQDHIMSEKKVMSEMLHPFLINLFATYKDRHYLYFLLEPSLGGELFVVLRNVRTFDEPTSKFFGASVLLAFEYMHSLDIVYRDLKPENLLLDKEGFLKVTDFGFAKVVANNERTYTLCGTPEYLAPELVSGKGHGKGIDWWTLGILIFEMLAGYTPFYHQDHLKMYELIARGKYRCPSHFSSSARHLIAALLERKPTRRLGVVRGGAPLIKSTTWFKGFDFEGLQEMKLKPPIKPKLKNDEDVSNFKDYANQKANALEYIDDGTNWDADF